ncbi:MAG: glycosyl transferase family 2, partial [Nitrospirales bacterium]
VPDTMDGLLRISESPPRTFRIPDDLWARLIYDFAVAYQKRLMPRDHLLKALTPLYLGRTATFVLETQGLTSSEAETRIESLCQTFENTKPYLVERWKAAEHA